jgi:hypothetical protein
MQAINHPFSEMIDFSQSAAHANRLYRQISGKMKVNTLQLGWFEEFQRQ